MKKLLFILTIVSASVSAQQSDFGNWLIYFGDKKIKNQWNWWHEVQHRNYNAVGDLEQLLIRTGLGYNLTEGNNNVLFGYGYILSGNYVNENEKQNIEEHRIYQQYLTTQSFGRFALVHRYRFEQRWVENSEFKLRYRYFLSARMAINNPTFSDHTLYITGYNEIFLAGASPVFDRNRLYGGMGYQLNKHTRFELGYMNQFFENGGRDQLNIVMFHTF